MLYHEFHDLKLSALGFGMMRLPVIDGDNARPDQKAVNRLVDMAIEGGVNYFDTAWGYHGGRSEIVTGRALARHRRDSFYLATKFPGNDVANIDRIEEIFERQLEKTGTDHVDFYLLHNVCEENIDNYLDPAHGIMDYLRRQRDAGRIRHLGFSAHGAIPCMRRFLDAYGEDMEFCQLQINYLDWEFQDARGKVDLLDEYDLPVWVMEPVRGGKLAKLSAKDAAQLRRLRPDESPSAWAFRFVQGIPQVVVTLSGMSGEAQLRENIATFSAERPLEQAERAALQQIVDGTLAQGTVPCTACQYCASRCPRSLDIPGLLSIYNEHIISGGGFLPKMLVGMIEEDRRPDACVACGACAAVCPQQIDIPAALADFAARLAG